MGTFAPTFAAETAEIDLSQKPVDTPTLDYLKDNNILIPQKGEWNATDKTWSEADPIPSPGSAYTITEGTEADYSFVYTTADEEGNLTNSYYKINLDSADLGTSGSITWTEVETSGDNTIQIKLPNKETKYYHYEYTMPDDYTQVSERINNTLF